MDETETILKPETKTERRLITMISCTPVYFSTDSLYTNEQGGMATTARARPVARLDAEVEAVELDEVCGRTRQRLNTPCCIM